MSIVGILVAGAVFVPGAHAACSSPEARGTGAVVHCGPTGAEQSWVVPAGVTRLHVTTQGAFGGPSEDNTYGAGPGAVVAADLPVSPGRTLYVLVGGLGTRTSSGPGAGGFNGGGSSDLNGGGGGASDVRTCSSRATSCDTLASRLIVAGGGGGGGHTFDRIEGSFGGGSAGLAGNARDGDFIGTGGGAGATRTAGGAAGDGATAGAAGVGGNGSNGGGGGGGGLYGGGGGGGGGLYGGGGGGGGSSFGPAGATYGFPQQGGPAGSVTIAYVFPPPTVVVTRPSAGQVLHRFVAGKRRRLVISGRAGGSGGVKAVALAIEQLSSSTGTPRVCRWLNPSSGLERRSCDKPPLLFATVRADGAWTYRIPKAIKLPAGRYRVTAYGQGTAGAFGNSASARQGRITFRLSQR